MIENISFQNSQLIWPVMLIGIAIWLLFIWKEWRRPLPKLFLVSCLVSLLTIAAVAMLALQPKTSFTSNTVGLILTDLHQAKKVDSLKKLERGLQIFQYQENLSIESKLDSLKKIYILGDGVETFDLWQFENRAVTFIPNDIPKGITTINYELQQYAGESLMIHGRYNVPKKKNRLVLEDGSGKAQDSVIFKENNASDFILKTPLKSQGKFVYQLVEKDSFGTVLSRNNLPIQVVEKQQLKVLIINGFPSFETKYLKNYLSSLGHELVVRSQITKGRYKFEYLNTARKPIYTLNSANLKEFDLLVISSNSYRNLSNQTKSSIANSVSNDGLGLFLQPDANLFRLSEKNIALQFQSTTRSEIKLKGMSNQVWSTYKYSIAETLGLEKIHFNDQQIVSGYKRWGSGRIGTTMIQNTFEFQLEGKQETYRQFWSEIVGGISKKQTSLAKWGFSNMFPLKNEPLSFELNSSNKNPRVFHPNGNRIALKQDFDLPTAWKGVVYPRNMGWHELHLENDSTSTASFYVTDSLSWTALKRYQKQLANRRLFNHENEFLKETIQYENCNPFWFFMIALLGFAFLWLRPKFFQS